MKTALPAATPHKQGILVAVSSSDRNNGCTLGTEQVTKKNDTLKNLWGPGKEVSKRGEKYESCIS